jgi:hypothetical protein
VTSVPSSGRPARVVKTKSERCHSRPRGQPAGLGGLVALQGADHDGRAVWRGQFYDGGVLNAMWKKRVAPRAMPTWDQDPRTAIQHLNDLEASLKAGQIQVWRDSGVSEEEIVRIAPKVIREPSAVFNAWRDEVRARLGLGA